MIRRLLPIFASLLAATVRLQWRGEVLPERCIVMFWHGKMFAGWFCARARRPIALVSQSKDGDLLAGVLHAWGYQLSRGSSRKGGREALDRAIRAVRSDAASRLVITPDGPRGPFHRFKRGAFIAAQELELPLYFLQIHYASPIVFTRSWDRFELPKPFSRVVVNVVPVDASGFPQDPDEQRMWLDELASELEHLSAS